MHCEAVTYVLQRYPLRLTPGIYCGLASAARGVIHD